MNYKEVYDSLIRRAKTRKLKGYGEKHHIVPKCLGGNDDIENLAELTSREHYICHLLLVRIYPDNPKLWYALNAMINLPGRGASRYTPSSRVVEEIRLKISKLKQETCWIHDGSKTKKIKMDVLEEHLNNGWQRGRKVSYTKEKIAVRCNDKTKYIEKASLSKYLEEGYETGTARKGKKLTKNSENQKGRCCVNNGKETKRILAEDVQRYLDKGWKRGYHYTIDYTVRDYSKNKNRVCVHNNMEEKRVKKEDLAQYLQGGWVRGHRQKN